MDTDNIQIVGINIHEYLHYLCFTFNFQLQVGIKGDTFSLVYEPEAASVYARLLPVDRFIGENKMVALKTFDIGRKFIVLDAGGIYS
jgi:hypothetical protein